MCILVNLLYLKCNALTHVPFEFEPLSDMSGPIYRGMITHQYNSNNRLVLKADR